ncbi:MAG: 30S ribosomal protein S9 [Parcubacteria group bacterium]|nr:30S ribosomal protein S9 [Parcubacteria group bacterium]
MADIKTKSKVKKVEVPARKKGTVKPKEPLSLEKKDTKRYFEAVGRRKRAVARVRIFTANPKDSAAEGIFTINNKNIKDYFTLPFLRELALESLNKLRAADHFSVSVKVSGGGINAQAEAIRLGIARALVKFDPNFRRKLKKSSLLRRDPREKERRKYGLKKARRAPQFSKR